jgi:hypothetical protein
VSRIFDVREELPRLAEDFSHHWPKVSVTLHWNGPPIPTWVHPLEIILADAHYHLRRDNAPEIAGRQGADGILYHRMYTQSGDRYDVRDPEDALWHCGNEWGNQSSWAWQLMIGTGQRPSAPMLAAVARDLAELDFPRVYPHGAWSRTECPGDDITDWIAREGWKEELHVDQPTQAAIREACAKIVELSNALIAFLKTSLPIWLDRMAEGRDVGTGARASDQRDPTIR